MASGPGACRGDARLSREHGFAIWIATGILEQGWAMVQQDGVDEGIARIREGLEAFRVTGGRVMRPRWLSPLAQAYGAEGRTEEGLDVLADAFAQVEETGERWYEAELHRLKGELTSPTSPDAEAAFHRALEVARRQGSRSLELRAATSLARFWQRQGKRGEARALLAEVYGWFTESFDTRDLTEARALLEALS